MACKPAGHVHGADGMDKAGVLRRGIDPASALELINMTEALNPGGIDEIFFGLFAQIGMARWHGEGYILVNRISDQGRAIVGSVELACGLLSCHGRDSILS
jgi:hypothetical protein